MKNCLTLFVCMLLAGRLRAQQIVVDPEHFAAVVRNAAVRSSAESTHEQYLSKINGNINDLNTNVASVVLAQNMIYESLSNVNSALKNGLAVKNMAVIIADMTGYISQAMELAKAEPYLFLFAGNISSEMRTRAAMIVSDVSGFIIKEGSGVLADYNARDELLHKVTQQLQILDGLAYGTWKAMYWAKQRGIIAAATPFADYLNRDKVYVSQIIQNAKFLKP